MTTLKYKPADNSHTSQDTAFFPISGPLVEKVVATGASVLASEDLPAGTAIIPQTVVCR